MELTLMVYSIFSVFITHCDSLNSVLSPLINTCAFWSSSVCVCVCVYVWWEREKRERDMYMWIHTALYTISANRTESGWRETEDCPKINLGICNAWHRLPRWLNGKESAGQAGNTIQPLDQEDSPGEGNGNPPQYSCLENPMDRGA